MRDKRAKREYGMFEIILSAPVIVALITSIIPQIPTISELILSLFLNINPTHVSNSLEQQKLWVRNFNCKLESSSVETSDRIEIFAGVCPLTGDVQVRFVDYVEDNIEITWIDKPDFIEIASLNKQQLGTPIIFEYETINISSSSSTFEVLCQLWEDDGYLKQVINREETCFIERINTYTGEVLESKEHPSCECSNVDSNV